MLESMSERQRMGESQHVALVGQRRLCKLQRLNQASFRYEATSESALNMQLVRLNAAECPLPIRTIRIPLDALIFPVSWS